MSADTQSHLYWAMVSFRRPLGWEPGGQQLSKHLHQGTRGLSSLRNGAQRQMPSVSCTLNRDQKLLNCYYLCIWLWDERRKVPLTSWCTILRLNHLYNKKVVFSFSTDVSRSDNSYWSALDFSIIFIEPIQQVLIDKAPQLWTVKSYGE